MKEGYWIATRKSDGERCLPFVYRVAGGELRASCSRTHAARLEQFHFLAPFRDPCSRPIGDNVGE